MEYRLDFESNQFIKQSPNRVVEIELIKRNLEEELGIKINLKNSKYKLDKNLNNFYLESDGDIDELISAVDGKTKIIKELGIEEIYLWRFYEHLGQCNMEFTSDQLLKMGRNEVKFLISCWEKQPDELYQTVENSIKAKFHNDSKIKHFGGYYNLENKHFIELIVDDEEKKTELQKYIKDNFSKVDFVNIEIK